MGLSRVYESHGVRVSTLRDRSSYSVIVTPGSGKNVKIGLLDTPWDVRAVTDVAGGKILIDQPSSGDGEEVYVIDARSGLLIDKFGCEHPALSPSRQYLAFMAAYPLHSADDDLTSDFVMLYRLDGDATSNHDSPRTDFPLMDVPDRRMGTQVFPSRRAPLKGAAANGKKRRTYAVLSAFAWSPDSRQFLFLDEQTPGAVEGGRTDNSVLTGSANNQPTLLLVDVSLNNRQPVVTAMPAPDCSQASYLDCNLQVGQTKFGKTGLHMVGTVAGHAAATRTLDIPYADFRTLPVE